MGLIPWGRKWQLTPVFLPGKPHGREAWPATIYEVTKQIRYDLASKQQP